FSNFFLISLLPVARRLLPVIPHHLSLATARLPGHTPHPGPDAISHPRAPTTTRRATTPARLATHTPLTQTGPQRRFPPRHVALGSTPAACHSPPPRLQPRGRPATPHTQALTPFPTPEPLQPRGVQQRPPAWPHPTPQTGRDVVPHPLSPTTARRATTPGRPPTLALAIVWGVHTTTFGSNATPGTPRVRNRWGVYHDAPPHPPTPYTLCCPTRVARHAPPPRVCNREAAWPHPTPTMTLFPTPSRSQPRAEQQCPNAWPPGHSPHPGLDTSPSAARRPTPVARHSPSPLAFNCEAPGHTPHPAPTPVARHSPPPLACNCEVWDSAPYPPIPHTFSLENEWGVCARTARLPPTPPVVR
ncbi:hypothetical protein BC826DRAFT_974197, partial [Russula brevipes]